MRILLISPRYFPHIGGVEYVVKSIAERLAKMGHYVTVLAGESNIDKLREEYINNVRVLKWPTWTLKEAYHIPRKLSQFISLIKELGKEMDVVHVHSAHAVLPVYAGNQLKQMYPDTKLIFTLHYHACGHTLLREFAWRILWRTYVGKLVNRANKIHAVSVNEAERILVHYPVARNKLIVIPNGIEEDVLKYKWKGQNSDYTIYAGRIERYKRIEKVYEVIKKIDQNLKLLIVGTGSYLRELKKKFVDKDVEFLPPQPREKYLQILSHARYAINLSINEAFSIFIAEALTMGVPCIASVTIAKALNAETIKLPNIVDAVLLRKAKMITWNEVTTKLISLLYTTYIK